MSEDVIPKTPSGDDSEADLYTMLYNEGFDESPAEYKSGLHEVEKGIYGYDYMYSFDYASGFIQHNSYLGIISLSLEPIIWGNSQTSMLLSEQ